MNPTLRFPLMLGALAGFLGLVSNVYAGPFGTDASASVGICATSGPPGGLDSQSNPFQSVAQFSATSDCPAPDGGSGFASASASLPTGTLKVLSSATGAVGVFSVAEFFDVLTFGFDPGTTSGVVTLGLTVDGVISGDGNVGISLTDLTASPFVTQQKSACGPLVAPGSICDLYNVDGTAFTLSLPDFASLEPGSATISFLAHLQAGAGKPSGLADASHTAQLSLQLSDGIFLESSASGVFLTEVGAPGSIPEPQSILLVCTALFALTVFGRRRFSWTETNEGPRQ